VNTTNVSLVPLQQASLCMDCETITAGYTHCLGCGSRALLNLARVLSQNAADRSFHLEKTPVPISFPLRQRHIFRPIEQNVGGRLERLEAAPMQFSIGRTRNRHETFGS
jgi:hypothetical protein